ncbi:MAG: hypothetical protein WCB99_05235 [Candidatus Cybelea sp.]|jgi:DNA-binding beta-propeller fold protein YncE
MQQKSRVLTLCGFALGASIVAGCASQSSSGPSAGALAPAGGSTTRAATGVVTLGAHPESAAGRLTHGWLSPEARRGKKLVYVSDQQTDTVTIYPARKTNPAPIGSITEGVNIPDGLAVDAKGDLYVANAGSTTVTVYPPGRTTPSFTYSPGQNPVAVVVGSDKTVYIAQGFDGCLCITEYVKGSGSPKLTIPLDQTGGSPIDVALDASNNLYVALTNATVYKFAPGQTSGSNLGLDGLTNPRGLAFDKQGDLVVANDTLNFNAGDVDIYPPGQQMFSKQFVPGPQPFEITFGLGRKLLYVANVSYGDTGLVAIFNAKQGYKQVGTISQGLEQPLGVALSPDAK